MRVISGMARGTKLYSLEGNNTRPTLDRVKESLFNIIGMKIRDSIVLDLFSGSGAIGIEAASRGAQKVILCDKSKDAINIINKNIEKTRLKENTIVINSDYKEALKKANCTYDIIYIDPPYATNLVKDSVEEILKNEYLKDSGIIIIETDEEERINKELDEIENKNIDIYDKRKYGRVILIFLRKG